MLRDIKIKTYPNGIMLYLYEDMSFEEIYVAVRDKFLESKKFFGNSKLCLSFSGKPLTEEEETYIANLIEEVTDIKIMCIVQKEEDALSHKAGRLLDKAMGLVPPQEYTKIKLNNDDREIQIIELLPQTPRKIKVSADILIMGNLKRGYNIKASGNVIVFGGVYGKLEMDKDKVLICLDLDPDKLAIDGILYKPKKGLFGKKSKGPKRVYITDDVIVAEDIEDTDIYDEIFL